MSGAAVLNESAKKQLKQIFDFAQEMQDFCKEQTEQLNKDPRMDIDAIDRSKLYTAMIKTYERSEANRNLFMTNSSGKDKTDYMKDYQEFNSDDDYEAGIDGQDFNSDEDTDLRGRYGQSALAKEMNRSNNKTDFGLDISQFDELEAILENSHLGGNIAPNNPEPKLRIPEGYMPLEVTSQKSTYQRNNWVADGEEKE